MVGIEIVLWFPLNNVIFSGLWKGLYCKRCEGLSRQIENKSRVFLGPKKCIYFHLMAQHFSNKNNTAHGQS
jgi:hypothetical protein